MKIDDAALLRARSVEFGWRDSSPLLLDLNLHVSRGEAIAVLGRSGCGKTTLLKLLAGLLRPTAGQVTFRGNPLESPTASISMVFQDYPCFPWLRVRRNIGFGLRNNPFRESSAEKERVDELLSRVGLQDASKLFPSELSGGMRQRVSVARALAVRPEVILLDEPFSALDAVTKYELMELLADLRTQYGFALLCVLHDLDDAYEIGERTIVLSGRPSSVGATLSKKSYRNFDAYRKKVLELLRNSDR